jgi:hypothetical protein
MKGMYRLFVQHCNLADLMDQLGNESKHGRMMQTMNLS